MANSVEYEDELIAVLDHFYVQHDAWLHTLDKFERTFSHAVTTILPSMPIS